MPKNHLSENEMDALVKTIHQTEECTSGEIRIHIDTEEAAIPAQKAINIFHELGMHKTKERNAVLFYVHFHQKYLTIIGDEGIHQWVHQSFWDELHDEMTQKFAQERYFDALNDAVKKTGEQLQKFFPNTENKENELPNELSFS